METSAEWIVRLAAAVASGVAIDPVAGIPSVSEVVSSLPLAGNATLWRTLDIGTGNGLLLHRLAKHGWVPLRSWTPSAFSVHTSFSAMLSRGAASCLSGGCRLKDLTGCDYCEAAVELARAVAQKAGLASIQFLVSNHLLRIFSFCSCSI